MFEGEVVEEVFFLAEGFEGGGAEAVFIVILIISNEWSLFSHSLLIFRGMAGAGRMRLDSPGGALSAVGVEVGTLFFGGGFSFSSSHIESLAKGDSDGKQR